MSYINIKREQIDDIVRQLFVFFGKALFWVVVVIMLIPLMFLVEFIIGIPVGLIGYKIHQITAPEFLGFMSQK
ncbi:hypothetical protein F6R98_06555 [Candidatus Methylospira mobilis]|uniref:Uncharacterized protein n=1 Tax=Candidatus Methylospira mobilis TaxID=1808979 RepID=A0A5Q0BFL9_9GAMM|nr:hypothetical protein [Candidatus Methylospira mobilis]QFY42329.1 hypothetical protein F6R98_06555 [Candidatus Methylospira mobilis]